MEQACSREMKWKGFGVLVDTDEIDVGIVVYERSHGLIEKDLLFDLIIYA